MTRRLVPPAAGTIEVLGSALIEAVLEVERHGRRTKELVSEELAQRVALLQLQGYTRISYGPNRRERRAGRKRG